MKNLFLIVLFSIAVLGSAFAQKSWTTVGQLQNGKPVLSIDKEQALKTYNKNLKQLSDIDGNFTDVKLVSHSSGSYALVFIGAQYISSFAVRDMGRGVLAGELSTSCTTSDCSQETMGCVPNYNGGDVANCRPCANGGTCTKTVTASSLF